MRLFLRQRVGAELKWEMSIIEVPHVSGYSYPVFQWNISRKNGLVVGELAARPFPGILFFHNHKGITYLPFSTIKEALGAINKLGKGKPPYIDEVFQDVLETKKKFPIEDSEEAGQVFSKLRKKWESLIADGELNLKEGD